MNEKKKFLVVYDTGTSGIWSVIYARSSEEILRKYPVLSVILERPGWMTDEVYNKIAEVRTFDIDDPPSGWLQLLASGVK
jgi:hypothetical protein